MIRFTSARACSESSRFSVEIKITFCTTKRISSPVYTLAQLYGIENEDLTPIARQGSGSACRSLDGGFVHWVKGISPTGEDSVAVQLCDENYWPEMRVLILVVNEGKKAVSSTNGMTLTATTSELFNYRIMKCVPERIRLMKKVER